VAKLEKKWPDIEATGFKVGVASGRVLVKRIGIPCNPAEQEPVWAGRPVNYAAKAAQGADRHELVVSGSVWDKIESNDYLTITCGCGRGPTDSLWKNTEIARLPEDDDERLGRLLTSKWCAKCGPGFYGAILAGKKKRYDVEKARPR
jgi:class 3 adenylate cyclase